MLWKIFSFLFIFCKNFPAWENPKWNFPWAFSSVHNAQSVPQQQSVSHSQLPPVKYAGHDVFWMEYPFGQFGSPVQGVLPLSFLCTCFGQLVENWEVLDLATTKPTKHSTVPVTRKKMSSIPTETRAWVQTAWRCNWRYCFFTMEMEEMTFSLEALCFGASGVQCEVIKAPLFLLICLNNRFIIF